MLKHFQIRRTVRLAALAVVLIGSRPLLPVEAAAVDAARCAGFVLTREELPFQHVSGRSEQKHLPETMGAGLAWIDVDGDGWRDLYLVQSGRFPPSLGAESANVLLRNREGTLVPWRDSGAEEPGYGQGALALDVDGDGDLDLVVTNYGSVLLLRNRGNGTFALVSDSGLDAGGEWTSSAAAADADGDGDLDLYVSHYLAFDGTDELYCGDAELGVREYCDPSLFEGLRDRYYRNDGTGLFEEVGEQVGLAEARGKGLGVLFVDVDDDRHPDLYVANDLTLNLLLHNRGDGTFEDVSVLSGAAVNGDGKPEAGMGLAVGDWDRDGDADLAVTNFDVETNTLYRQAAPLFFEDVAAQSGFGVPSFNLLGFGLVSEDLDLDGALDFYVANGHIFEQPKRENVTYRQRDLLLRGDGSGRFEEIGCPALAETPHVGRGLAASDFDLDGDVDLALVNNDGPAMLWRNGAADRGGRWLGVELVGAAPNPEAIGAVVTLVSGSYRDRRWVHAGNSYQSSSDRRLIFGLPRALEGKAAALEVEWPRGGTTRIAGLGEGVFLRVFEESQ